MIKVIKNKNLISTLTIFWYLITVSIGSLLVTRPSIDILRIWGINIHFVQFFLLSSYAIFFYLYFFLIKQKVDKYQRRVLIFIHIFSSLEIFFSYAISLLDQFYYPNFVYSRFHIYPPFLYNFTNLLLILLAFTIIWYLKSTKLVKEGIVAVFLSDKSIVIKMLILFVFATSVMGSFKTIIVEVRNIKKTQKLNVDFNLKAIDLGDFSYDMNFIVQNTAPNSVILHPEQSEDFPLIGNEVLDRYFLYPRILVSPGKVLEFSKDYLNKICDLYSIVSVGPPPERNVFPTGSLDITSFKYLGKNNESFEINSNKYDQRLVKNMDNFKIGIIKYKKCSI